MLVNIPDAFGDADEFEITSEMLAAGIEEYGLFDAADRPEWVVCAVYRAMARASRKVERITDGNIAIAEQSLGDCMAR